MRTETEPAADRRAPALDEPTYGASFWIGLGLGGAVMVYAVWGMAQNFSGAERTSLATWIVGAALAHDVVLAPLVTIVGLVLAWVLPRSVRGPVLGAFVVSGLVVLFSWPALRAYGRRDVNPSILPHDYPRNVAIVIGAVWLTAAVLVVVRRGRGRVRS